MIFRYIYVEFVYDMLQGASIAVLEIYGDELFGDNGMPPIVALLGVLTSLIDMLLLKGPAMAGLCPDSAPVRQLLDSLASSHTELQLSTSFTAIFLS